MSVYESAPDSFNFSQSWGWKSSTLMLDDGGVFGGSDRLSGSGPASAGVAPGVEGATEQDDGAGLGATAAAMPAPGLDGIGPIMAKMKGSKYPWRRTEGVLRFMVVIGNV